MPKFSPGPWKRGDKRTYGIYANGQPRAIATVQHWEGELTPADTQAELDADLVADAPEMYALLEKITKAFDGPRDEFLGLVLDAQSLVNKHA